MKKILCILLCSLLIIGISACTKERSQTDEAEAIMNKGCPILETYIHSLDENANIISCEMMVGQQPHANFSYSTDYLSHIVVSYFEIGNSHYEAYVNIEDESILTNYKMFDVNEAVKEQLKPYFEKYGYTEDFNVTNANLLYVLESHNIIPWVRPLNVHTFVEGVYPAESKDVNEAMTNASLSGFTIECDLSANEFDPHILIDYLKESGNYRVNDDYYLEYKDYHVVNINGYEENKSVGYDFIIDIYASFDESEYCLYQYDYKEINEFSFIYGSKEKTGLIKSFDKDEMIEYECPFSVEDNVVTYIKQTDKDKLFFKEMPSFNKITRINYQKENDSFIKESEMELEIGSNESGNYVLMINDEVCHYLNDKIEIIFE